MFNIFNKNKSANLPTPKVDLEVLLHKECNGHIEHGTVYADNRMLGLSSEPIRFAFANVDQAPELTPDILAHVWNVAESKGYIVHSLRSYATVVTLMPAPTISVSTPNRRSGQGIATTPRKRNDQPHNQRGTPVVS